MGKHSGLTLCVALSRNPRKVRTYPAMDTRITWTMDWGDESQSIGGRNELDAMLALETV